MQVKEPLIRLQSFIPANIMKRFYSAQRDRNITQKQAIMEALEQWSTQQPPTPGG